MRKTTPQRSHEIQSGSDAAVDAFERELVAAIHTRIAQLKRRRGGVEILRDPNGRWTDIVYHFSWIAASATLNVEPRINPASPDDLGLHHAIESLQCKVLAAWEKMQPAGVVFVEQD